jgi:hypothetical protein
MDKINEDKSLINLIIREALLYSYNHLIQSFSRDLIEKALSEFPSAPPKIPQ